MPTHRQGQASPFSALIHLPITSEVDFTDLWETVLCQFSRTVGFFHFVFIFSAGNKTQGLCVPEKWSITALYPQTFSYSLIQVMLKWNTSRFNPHSYASEFRMFHTGESDAYTSYLSVASGTYTLHFCQWPTRGLGEVVLSNYFKSDWVLSNELQITFGFVVLEALKIPVRNYELVIADTPCFLTICWT